ncbi:hypothetical protein [Aureimonas mangrovi]|uniref:hypothetical protein n=1 Tax=Aureimonas mangrovi TaxID=2758041 RepID=UPI00163D9FA6|nr:hypothetical protein [Aureimonas mangrovi]
MSNTPDTGASDPNAGESFDLNDAIGAAFDEISATEGGDAPHSGDAAAAAAEQHAAVSADTNTPAETPAANAEQAEPAPDQWSEKDDAALAALSPEVKSLVERRIKAIEAEHTGKTEAMAADVELGKGIRSVVDEGGFRDVLAQSGMNEVQGVQYLANLERFARERPADYLRFVADHVRQRFGLDPAKELGLTGDQRAPSHDDAFQDPRVADLQQQLGALSNHVQQDAMSRRQEAVRQTIDTFKNAKDASGALLHPHLEDVKDDMAAYLRANPGMSLDDAYGRAVWANPTARQKVQQAEQEAAQRKQRSEAANAAKAARSNVRGGGRSMETSPTIKSSDDAVNAAIDAIGGI